MAKQDRRLQDPVIGPGLPGVVPGTGGLLRDRKALVTGGGSGIGRAVAAAFACEGADVAFAYAPEEEEEARVTARLVEDAGRKAVPVECDIREEVQCRRLVEQVVEEFGRIDILVNNAAYQQSQPAGIGAISTEQFDRVMRTNLYGMFWLTKMTLPHMPRGGCVINSASAQAYRPDPDLLDYAMTKGAVATFTQGLARMLESDGIRVNAVEPGPADTPVPPAGPAECATTYVFLASPQASGVTTEIINATGGTPLP